MTSQHPLLNVFDPPRLFKGDLNNISEVPGAEDAIKNVEKSAELLKKSQEILDQDGNRIINANSEKIWFANNVAFVFIRGIGFDDRDFNKLNDLLKIFSSAPDCAYLLNLHYEIDYFDSLAEQIENQYHIESGNYHILFVILSYADDTSNSIDGTISEYAKSGVIKILTDFSKISKDLNDYLQKFGFLAFYDRSNEKTTAQSRGSYLQPDANRSRINIDISLSSLPQPSKEDIESQQAILNEQNLRRENIEKAISQRAPKNITEDQRFKSSKSIMSRIRERSLETTQPSELGGTLRMNEYWLPPEERKPELEFYPNMPYSYDQATASNYFVNANPAFRDVFPQALYTPTSNEKYKSTNPQLPIGNSLLVKPK